MKRIKDIIKGKYFFYAVSITVFFVIALNIPLVADDYSFSLIESTTNKISNIFELFESIFINYSNWGGRIFAYGSAELCLLGNNHILFDLLYPVFNTIIIEEIVQLFDNKKTWLYYLFLAVLLSHHILVLNQTLFWIVGWSTYVASLVPLLYVIKYVKNSFDNKENKGSNIYIFFFSIIGCLFVEIYSLIIICLSFICLIKEIIYHRIHSETIYLMFGAIIGCLIIFLAPGMLNRAGTGILPNSSFSQQLLFGWTRFIYCFFFMNQRIFFLLSITIIGWLFYKHDKCKLLITIMLMPIIILSMILIIKPAIVGPVVSECLTGEWSYYTCKAEDVFKCSFIVVYYIVVLLVCVIYICCIIKNYFIFYLYGAAICSNLCFITTTLACERTQFISYILLTIITLCLLDGFVTGKMLRIIIPIVIVIITYQSIKYINAYSREYQIYKYNDNLFRECAKTKQKEIYIHEHDYRYIFRSDLYFDNQDMWIFDMFRRYYNLDDDVMILPK